MTSNTSTIVGLTSTNSNLLPITFQSETIGKSAIIDTTNINIQISESNSNSKPIEKTNQNTNNITQSTKIPINFENGVTSFKYLNGQSTPSPYTLKLTRLVPAYFSWSLGQYTADDETKYGNPLILCASTGGTWPWQFETIPTFFREFQNVSKVYTNETISYLEDRVNMIDTGFTYFVLCQIYVNSNAGYAFRIQDLTRNKTVASTANTGNSQKVTLSGWLSDFYDQGVVSIAVQCKKVTINTLPIYIGFPVANNSTYDGLTYINFQIIQI